MPRRLLLALLAALALAQPSAADAAGGGQPPIKESENPINDQGSNYHYRTYITSITPRVRGLSVEVLEFADRLLIRNHTGMAVTVFGYSGEPYARIAADGAAEQNTRSPAVYLNTSFYANVSVPSSASATASPRWEVVDRTGAFEWHDHRIHWMSPVKPPQVRDAGRRTRIFNWTVPIRVGNENGAISGELFWVPNSSSAPVGAIVALIAIAAVGAAVVIVSRRRRRLSAGGAANGDDQAAAPEREAW